jgi:hypothetical protein
MIFKSKERFSDSLFVERVWRAETENVGKFTSVAASHWEMVVTRFDGKMTFTVRGPETHATPLSCSIYAEWLGISFKYGTFMPRFPMRDRVDGSFDLPEASGKSFWLNGSAWEFPDFENADQFVARLVKEGLLVRDPLVASVLKGEPQRLSPRSVQRRFLRTTGLTHGAIRQIERARRATLLLKQDVAILDVVEQTGYADQAHLTRALKYYIGHTPAQIVGRSASNSASNSTAKADTPEMSLLFKTTEQV